MWSRYYSCTGKLCLPVSRKKLFFPSPDTLPQTEILLSFSLFHPLSQSGKIFLHAKLLKSVRDPEKHGEEREDG